MSEPEPSATIWDIELVPNLVKRIFRQVLERESTPIELINYGCKLARGEMSIKEIIEYLILEEEYDEYEDRFIEPYPEEIRVKYCFNHLLARDPTPDELEQYIEISVDEGIDNVIRMIMSDSDLYTPGDDGIAFERDSITSGVWIYLQASNGMFVCAENGGGGNLNANRYKPLGWETFTIGKVDGGIGDVINVNDQVFLQTSNGSFVKAAGGGGGELITNPDQLGWETFVIGKVDGGIGEIGDGDLVWLKTYNGQNYLCTHTDEPRLYATATNTTELLAQFTISIQYLR